MSGWTTGMCYAFLVVFFPWLLLGCVCSETHTCCLLNECEVLDQRPTEPSPRPWELSGAFLFFTIIVFSWRWLQTPDLLLSLPKCWIYPMCSCLCPGIESLPACFSPLPFSVLITAELSGRMAIPWVLGKKVCTKAKLRLEIIISLQFQFVCWGWFFLFICFKN